ncbi:MAG: peptidoglycan DD-metalloendopeptidase family protein [Spirochaetia bacterium]
MPVTQYKNVEKQFAGRFGSWIRRIWVSMGNFFKRIMQKGKQRFTVMLIPHSEKKIFNFQISFFTLIFVTITLGVVLVGFFLLATNFTYTNEKITKVSLDLQSNETTMQNLKDEISGIRKAGRSFKASMDNVMSVIGNQDYLSSVSSGGVGASYLAPEDGEVGNLKELADLKSMTSLMESSVEPLDEINKVLSTYKELLADTPTMWPLKGVRGNITTRFGWTIHPFTHLGYLHTGVDIAWALGTPVEATANGTVVQTGYTEDAGNFITIQHKYGFTTRYLHLLEIVTRKGTHVNRGDTIGYVGSTGLSTGPHLHYEVRLGANYVDPMNFLSITPDLAGIKVSGRATD